MRVVAAIAKWLAIAALAVIAGVAAWLWIAPPDLIRVATGYSAKIVCSNVFIARRDAADVLAVDVQAPGHPILKLVNVSVDADKKTVSAGLFGLFGGGLAVARDGFGCATVPDGDLAAVPPVPAVQPAAATTGIWPEGIAVEPSQDPALAAILDDTSLTGPGMRAVVVVHNGRIIGERYGAGFSAETPLLGWSMTKSVTAAIIGTLVRDGKLSLDGNELLEPWKADKRGLIELGDLTSMSSGLEFNEDYGDVTDVTRMLYLEPDMAGFAAAKPQTADRGTVWSYSSGTTLILSRIWQNAFASPQEALAWPRTALFDPIGMKSAVLETDARGTFVGSSYLYATARDWARFGLFMIQDGTWNGQAILPVDYVRWMRSEVPASKGEYGNGQVWLHGPSGGTPDGEDPDAGFDLPQDAYWFLGHDGQSIAVVPSKKLVVVRLGLTPSAQRYKSQGLVEALARFVPLTVE
ncbi:MAG: serine hydrolase [Rhizobiaceae bacterium]|nr:serine hydrolase [Rhizobiaceae bacterium]